MGSGLRFLLADTAEIDALTDGTMHRSSRAHRFLPFVLAVPAIKSPHQVDQLVITAFDIDGFAVNQGVRDRLPGTLYDSTEGRAGNSHVPAGLLMGHAQQIGQADSLTLINGETNLLQIKHGNSSGLEVTDFRIKCHPAFFERSDHVSSFMRLFSKSKNYILPCGLSSLLLIHRWLCCLNLSGPVRAAIQEDRIVKKIKVSVSRPDKLIIK
jgi:hypothetical protein